MAEFFGTLAAGSKPSSAVAAQMSKKFVSEADINEMPESARGSDAPYDPRPLYERLAEKKRIEEEEHAEKLRLSNQIKRLDPDELEFLASTESAKAEMQREIRKADNEALEAFRNAKMAAALPIPVVGASAVAGSHGSAPSSNPKSPATSKGGLAGPGSGHSLANTQRSILLKGVKRKDPSSSSESAEPGTLTAKQPPAKHARSSGSSTMPSKPQSAVTANTTSSQPTPAVAGSKSATATAQEPLKAASGQASKPKAGNASLATLVSAYGSSDDESDG
ncbi:N-terminal domain of NEFA-interacting nuclear protein NIP30-domain-containing protein [Entophlyctis helioformis]|nr:N-terminal domain of NEFA-interacting nuclear protein NIP30-domain-containing protein [Entophlyctis helioformis]